MGRVVLERRLSDALGELNPTLPAVHNGQRAMDFHQLFFRRESLLPFRQ